MATPIFARWGLNAREQRVASLALVVLAIFVFLAVPVGLATLVASRHVDNDELRAALESVNGARSTIHEQRARKDSIASRYQKKAPQLAGFLAQTATDNHMQVTDSQDREGVPIGKRYVERQTIIHLKKVGMLPIAKFLEAIEKSGYPVSVSRLNVRTRAGEADSYDVEVGVSAYDRVESPAPSSSATPSSSAP